MELAGIAVKTSRSWITGEPILALNADEIQRPVKDVNFTTVLPITPVASRRQTGSLKRRGRIFAIIFDLVSLIPVHGLRHETPLKPRQSRFLRKNNSI